MFMVYFLVVFMVVFMVVLVFRVCRGGGGSSCVL